MLHVTNGDRAAERLEESSVGGEVLPWRDVLHEGPVPGGLDLQELSALRATFVADAGWGDLDAVRALFAERDAALAAGDEHDEIVLWFEHDLYDQLQLIQVLDHLAGRERRPALTLVCIDRFPGIERFVGLGQLDPRQLATLFPGRTPVSDPQLVLARRAWDAFRSPDPRAVEELLATDTTELPFLGSALGRHLEQFPSTRNGLGRTEQGILQTLEAGSVTVGTLFRLDREREPSPFLGSRTFFDYVRRLGGDDHPLVELGVAPGTTFAEREVRLTDDGRAVLGGELDAVELNGIDRWWGGVHQQGDDALWRWNGRTRRIVRSEF